MAGALEGMRVVEFASYISGPFARMLLGDFGAEVIKVASPSASQLHHSTLILRRARCATL
jgi:CoA:oxalate CoA-transferase